jgi:N-acetylmuramoyl-L-alanine amidase
MHHQHSHCTERDLRVWRFLFFGAIFALALPAYLTNQGQSAALANNSANSALYTLHASVLTRQTPKSVDRLARANPHPPVYIISELARIAEPVPNLGFVTALKATSSEQPYQIRSVFDIAGQQSWAGNKPVLKPAELKSSLANKARPSQSLYLALFQPKIEPKPRQWVVVIDAGHGGSDPGSQAENGLVEKELTLDIAKRTRAYLSKQDNVKVVLTRDRDKGMSRGLRVHKVKSSNADIVVSLHFNHLPQRDLNIVETFYAGQKNIAESQAMQMAKNTKKPVLKLRSANRDYGFTRHSKRLANIMQNSVYNEVKQNNPAVTDAGVKQDTLFILTRSFTPGVLIELSCISNLKEAQKLATTAYRDRMAEALAQGIKKYMTTTPAEKTVDNMEV